MKLSLGQKTLLVSILAIFCLVILGVFSVQHKSALAKSRYWIKHTGDVLYKTEQTFSELKDIESSVRGYVITGDSSFLLTYHKAVPAVWRYIHHLDTLTADNALQQLHIDTLRELVTNRLAISKNIIDNSKQNIAITGVAVKSGKMLMDKIRALIGRMDENENDLLVKRKAKNAAEEKETSGILYAFFIIVFLVFLLLIFSFWFTFKLNRQSLVKVKAKRNFFDNNAESIINSIEDPFFALDSKGVFLFANNAATNKLGFKQLGITSTNIFVAYSSYKTSETGLQMQQALQTGEPAGFEAYDDFSAEWKYINIHPVADGIIVHIQNAGDRKQEQMQLLKTISFYEDISQLAQVGGWDMDVEEGTIYWSQLTGHIYETEPAYAPNLKQWMGFFKPGESKDAIVKAVTQAMENGTNWDEQFVIITAKNNEKKVRICGNTELKSGSCVRVYGIVEEIK